MTKTVLLRAVQMADDAVGDGSLGRRVSSAMESEETSSCVSSVCSVESQPYESSNPLKKVYRGIRPASSECHAFSGVMVSLTVSSHFPTPKSSASAYILLTLLGKVHDF